MHSSDYVHVAQRLVAPEQVLTGAAQLPAPWPLALAADTRSTARGSTAVALPTPNRNRGTRGLDPVIELILESEN